MRLRNSGDNLEEFAFILYNVMLPIAIIVLLGYIVQIRLQLDRGTLGKMMINYIMPIFIFMNLYESDIDFSLLLYIMFFLFIFFCFVCVSIFLPIMLI